MANDHQQIIKWFYHFGLIFLVEYTVVIIGVEILIESGIDLLFIINQLYGEYKCKHSHLILYHNVVINFIKVLVEGNNM